MSPDEAYVAGLRDIVDGVLFWLKDAHGMPRFALHEWIGKTLAALPPQAEKVAESAATQPTPEGEDTFAAADRAKAAFEQREAGIGALRLERDALARFKAYVHKRLDDAGVPVDPPSEHRENGCRIGGRLDWLLAKAAQSGAAAPLTPEDQDAPAWEGAVSGAVFEKAFAESRAAAPLTPERQNAALRMLAMQLRDALSDMQEAFVTDSPITLPQQVSAVVKADAALAFSGCLDFPPAPTQAQARTPSAASAASAPEGHDALTNLRTEVALALGMTEGGEDDDSDEGLVRAIKVMRERHKQAVTDAVQRARKEWSKEDRARAAGVSGGPSSAASAASAPEGITTALRDAIGSVNVESDATGDNLAIALCTYFEDHLDCPDEEEDDECGWKPWVSRMCDRALDRIAQAAAKAIPSPAPQAPPPEGQETTREWSLRHELVASQQRVAALEAMLAKPRPSPEGIVAEACGETMRGTRHAPEGKAADLAATLQRAGAIAQGAVDHEALRAAAADSGVIASDEDQVADMREAAALLVGAADWIMREVVHQENRIGQEQTHARTMARAVRDQAKRLLDNLGAAPVSEQARQA